MQHNLTMALTTLQGGRGPAAPLEGNERLALLGPSRIKTWATSGGRVFTKNPWTTVVWTPSDAPSLTARERAAALTMAELQFQWWTNELDRWALGPVSGLPDNTFNNLGNQIEFKSGSITRDAVAGSSCGAAFQVLNDVLASQSNFFTSAGQAHNLVLAYGHKGISAGVVSATYPDLATAEADSTTFHSHTAIIQVGADLYQQVKYGAAPFFDPNGSADPAFREAWVNLGVLVSDHATAAALGPQASAKRIFIDGFGSWQNQTAGPLTFDINTWTPTQSSLYLFVACYTLNTGIPLSTAVVSTHPTRLGTQVLEAAVHEIGHGLGLQHGSKIGTKSVMSTSAEANPGPNGESSAIATSFFQAAMAYLSDSILGISNIPADYIEPSWTLNNLTFVPPSAGKWPRLQGTVITDNQASVPLLCAAADIDVDDGDFSEYTDRYTAAAFIEGDGTFDIRLDHFITSGTYDLTQLKLYNVGSRSNVANIAGITTNWTMP